MAELTIQPPDGPRRAVRLHRTELLVGRDPTCDLVLDDPTCSRRHFRIHSPRPGVYLLEDLGSHNGTRVNGERVVSRNLVHGDEIVAGRCAVRFTDRPSAARPTVVISDAGDLETDRTTVSVYRQEPSICESRLNQLLGLSARLVGTFEHRELLGRAMDICIETLHFDRGLIVEVPERPGEWQTPVVRNLRSGEDCTLTISRSILARAVERGERSIINNVADGGTKPTDSMVLNRICSALCVPITWQKETLGAIYGDRITTGQEYTEEDVNFLAGLATQIGAALKTSRLVQECQSRQQLENELAVARQIQEGLFPRQLPERDDLQIVAFNNPGRNVSGDYYDVIPLEGERFGIIIADVSGKGVPAAMLMANLQAAVRVSLRDTADLVHIVRGLNELVYDNTVGTKFITALVGVLDPTDRAIRYVNAGHYPPYQVLPDGHVSALPADAGLPLGVERDADYPVVDVSLGDRTSTLFLFTDGIPESLNQEDEFYGLGRIEDLLGRNARTPPSELVHRCRRTIADFVGHVPQSDDVTLMAVRLG